MRLPEEPDIPPQINIVPMIDVIFAILTFFIMSSLFLTRSDSLPVNLPQAATGEQQGQAQFIVTIDAKGKLSLNRESVQLKDLPQRLKTLLGGQQALVVINADEQVNHGQVIAVMDAVRTVPEAKLAIATRR
jgi:biopolymer transport protein ExbD